MSQSTNNNGALLQDDMNRLSLDIAAGIPLPTSSPVAPRTAVTRHESALPSGSTKPPLPRVPSSASLGGSERSTTPGLRKQTSVSSLQSIGGVPSPRSTFRRTSSNLASSPSSKMSARSNHLSSSETHTQTAATATTVAHEYFKKELQMQHEGMGRAKEAKTIVILQDDCYAHRYSRPRTSKANLSMIVERPERIHASILGLATAYVRLGGRHAEGHAAPHPKKPLTSLPAVPFNIQKTSRRLSLRSSAATAIHGAKWMSDLETMCLAAESKLALGGKELTRPNTTSQPNGNTHADQPKLHEGDLYLCSGSLNALEGALGGVVEGVDAIFSEKGPKRAFVCVRPPGHHCSAEMPSGFCWLNNVHVGIGHAALFHGLTHAAIIDFDLHHGDGSQSITWAHNARMASLPRNTPITKKTAIGYFSLHDINSYPCEVGEDEKVRNASLCIENAHGQSIWNVHLQPWKTDAEFWQLYHERYSVLLLKARSFLRLHSDRLRQAPTHPKPKAAIFISAGFDASEWESPGMQRHQVNVPTNFYSTFTRDVVSVAEEEGLGVDGRVISVLEGGYSDRALISGVLSHITGLTACMESSTELDTSIGLGHEMGQRRGRLEVGGESSQMIGDVAKDNVETLDPNWWSLRSLEEIESLSNPPARTVATKKQRNDPRPTYTSTTQSYTAKIVSPPQGRRSFSGPGATMHMHQTATPMSRASSPPPPAVYWATASHELSKLLVPSDRETMSCKPEDLNAEATRARRERCSTIGLPVHPPPPDPKRMQLRGRKGTSQRQASDEEEDKPKSRYNRRKTIADVSLLAQGIEPPAATSTQALTIGATKHARRRSSVASSAGSMHADKAPEFDLGPPSDSQPRRDLLGVNKSHSLTDLHMETAKPKNTGAQPIAPNSALSQPGERSVSLSLEAKEAPRSVNGGLGNKDVDHLATGLRQMSINSNGPSKPKPLARERASKCTAARPAKRVPPSKAKVKTMDERFPAKTPFSEPLLAQQTSPPSYGEKLPPSAPPQPEPTLQTTAQAPPGPLPESRPSLLPSPDSNVPAYLVMAASGFPATAAITGQIEPHRPRSAPLSPSEHTAPSTPIAVKHIRQDLPVFTSTSSISFGRPINVTPSEQAVTPSDMDKTDSVLLTNPTVTDNSSQAPSEELITSNSRSSSEAGRVDAEKASHQSNSIWDVPNTPQPRYS